MDQEDLVVLDVPQVPEDLVALELQGGLEDQEVREAQNSYTWAS